MSKTKNKIENNFAVKRARTLLVLHMKKQTFIKKINYLAMILVIAIKQLTHQKRENVFCLSVEVQQFQFNSIIQNKIIIH